MGRYRGHQYIGDAQYSQTYPPGWLREQLIKYDHLLIVCVTFRTPTSPPSRSGLSAHSEMPFLLAYLSFCDLQGWLIEHDV